MDTHGVLPYYHSAAAFITMLAEMCAKLVEGYVLSGFFSCWKCRIGPIWCLANALSDIHGMHNFREYREHVKDLSCVSKDFCRVVIVDNNPFSFILQPLNGIPCVPFSAGQHNDNQVADNCHQSLAMFEFPLLTNSDLFKRFQLMEVIFPLLKHLSIQRDVRPALYERFHMPEWFQKHGIPQTDQAV